MRSPILSIFLISFVFLVSCTSTIDKKMNIEDFDEVKSQIKTNSEYSEMEKAYLIDNISSDLMSSAVELALQGKEVPAMSITFKDRINELTAEFKDKRDKLVEAKKNNKKLSDLITLTDAKTFATDKYNGSLSLTVEFDNKFKKAIHYVVVEYKYIDDYDSKYFEETTKITDQVAKSFDGQVVLGVRHQYDKVSSFIWKKVPTSARKSLKDELGEEVANRKVERDFLMKGLKIETKLIVFKNKTEIAFEEIDWKYLDKNDK
tara:strand:+ start:6145 stop:6927 length:783 start_codon:yes stop_codon:yes gene_type:complete